MFMKGEAAWKTARISTYYIFKDQTIEPLNQNYIRNGNILLSRVTHPTIARE